MELSILTKNHLNIEINESKIHIFCENSCVDKKAKRSSERGNGMKIIKDIVKKYKGEFDFNIIENDEAKKATTKITLRTN